MKVEEAIRIVLPIWKVSYQPSSTMTSNTCFALNNTEPAGSLYDTPSIQPTLVLSHSLFQCFQGDRLPPAAAQIIFSNSLFLCLPVISLPVCSELLSGT